MRLVILVLEFVLEFGHVHAAGTFGLATFTSQAQVEGVKYSLFNVSLFPCVLICPSTRLLVYLCTYVAVPLTCALNPHHRPQQIGPSARGVGLLARGLERRAHHAAVLAAYALPVALFDGARQAVVAAKIQRRRPGLHTVTVSVPQMCIHRRRVQHLAGVEQVLWVGSAFEQAHGFHHLHAVGSLQELAARDPVAVFRRHRAAQPQRERQGGFGNRTQVRRAALQIQDRANVQASRRSVRIKGRISIVRCQNLLHLAHELAQPFYWDGTIFDERHRTRIRRA